jgi:hypothetical protein
MTFPIDFLLQFAVVIFSLLAAGFWTKCAAVKLPNIMENTTWAGTGPYPEAIKQQSKWNARAAVCATLAAMAQAGSLLKAMPFSPW